VLDVPLGIELSVGAHGCPSANAVGGSINYVNKQPTSGPIRNEVDAGVDSFGSFRTHFGSGGNTGVQGLDYRFDAVGSKQNSFIDGDFRDLAGLAAQLNYRVSSDFVAFAAFEYKNDYGHVPVRTPSAASYRVRRSAPLTGRSSAR
jgi:iron complex outermembrane receptor protein